MSKKSENITTAIKKYRSKSENPSGYWCREVYYGEVLIFSEANDPEIGEPRWMDDEPVLRTIFRSIESGTYQITLDLESGMSYEWEFKVLEGKVCELAGKSLGDIQEEYTDDRWNYLRNKKMKEVQSLFADNEFLFANLEKKHLGWTKQEWRTADEEQVWEKLIKEYKEEIRKLDERLWDRAKKDCSWVGEMLPEDLTGGQIEQEPF